MVTNDAYKLKESIFIDKTEAEIETVVLNLSNSKNEVPIMPDTQAMMTPQLLDSAQTHIPIWQYQQPGTTSFFYTKTNWNSCSWWE